MFEQEAHEEASIANEAPAPDAVIRRRGRHRARRARQAVEVDPKMPHVDIYMQAFMRCYL